MLGDAGGRMKALKDRENALGWRRLIGFLALGWAALASIVAVSVRDRFMLTGLVFYSSPWLVRGGFVVASWLLLRPKSRWMRVAAGLLAAHALLGALQSFKWGDAPPPPNHGSFDVTLWNAGRNLAKMPEEWGNLLSGDAQLAVIIEAGAFTDEEWKRFLKRDSGAEWTRYRGGILVGVRGKTVYASEHGDGSRFRCRKVGVEIGGKRYDVVAVDIPSQPWLGRERFLGKVLNAADGKGSLILGDFNTPPEARGFDSWERTHRLANGYAGRGFKETWACGVPLLTLDQLWLSSDLECVGLRKFPGAGSDHSRMVFRVAAVGR